VAIIHLASPLLARSSDLPESHQPVAAVRDRRSNFGGHRSPLQSLAERVTPPLLFGLAPCGVCPAPDIAIGAVRSYIKPLARPHLFTLTSPRFWRTRRGVAVFFLWHFPCRRRTFACAKSPSNPRC